MKKFKNVLKSIWKKVNSTTGDRMVTILALLTALISVVFSSRHDDFEEKSTEFQSKMQDKQNKFNKDSQKAEFNFAKSQASLVIGTKINETDLKRINVYDESKQLELTQDFPKLEITTKVGHILKITPIISHFLNTDTPYIDMTVRMYENDVVNFYDKEIIDGFLSNVINFYPAKGVGNYYVFYLIQGTGDKNYLVITGMRNIVGSDDIALSFVAGNAEMLSTVNIIDEDYKKEFFALKSFLEKSGIPIS